LDDTFGLVLPLIEVLDMPVMEFESGAPQDSIFFHFFTTAF
jgi:hypothetical protein